MGGMDSEIEDDTVDVMVESACFNAGRTSHTSRDLSLISDASIRFERQVDETGCVDVANVTCALIEEIAGGEVAPGYVDVFPAPKTIDSIKLRLARVRAICGADIEPDFIERSLTRLGCTVERDGEDFMVMPPSFRPDLPREIDLIEEVLRLWGMGRVTATIPAAKNHIGGLTREQKLTRKVGEILRACGMELPKHTFYVDNIFVYQPLPQVKTIYYMNLDLYRYFIGREDQSVNEANMIKRVDQQLRVTRIMMNAVDVYALPPEQAKLRAYMLNYFSMMMAISSIFLTLDGSKEALAKRRQLWDDLKAHDGHLYRRCRFSVAEGCNLPGWLGSKISIGGYRIAQKIFKFN